MRLSKTLLFVLVLSALGLGACGKKTSSSARIRGGATNGAGSGTAQAMAPVCSNGVSSFGYVTVSQGGFNSQFNQWGASTMQTSATPVADFLSASVNPQLVGTVNAQNGITITFRVQQQNGMVVAQGAMLNITVSDSYVGQVIDGEVAQPMVVEISNNASGSINSQTGQFNITFADSYGQITLNGNFDQSNAYGTVSYINQQSADGSAPKSGTLGSFQLPSCGVFN